MKNIFWLLMMSIYAFASTAGAGERELHGGQVIGLNIYGLAYDFEGRPLIVDNEPLIYSDPDENVTMAYQQQRFILSLFSGPVSTLYLTRLSKDNSLVNTEVVDTSSIQGLTHVSSALNTPWDSVLLPESLQLNARDFGSFSKAFSGYFSGKSARVNAYDYGWLSELVLLDKAGSNKVLKHYAVGRIGVSHAVVLPDQRTLYLYDGNYTGNLYLFIADEVSSLAKGTLYGISSTEDGSQLVRLGEASSMQVRLRLQRSTFADVYEFSDLGDGECVAGFTRVESYFGVECLRSKPKTKALTGLLEPVREFALQGGAGPGKGFDRLHVSDSGTRLVLQGPNGKREWQLGRDDSLKTDFAPGVKP